MDSLTLLDIIITVVFLYFIINGYNKGFIDQTSTILGLLIALYMAIKYYSYFQGYLAPYLEVSQPMLQFISFAVIFVVFNIVIHILGVVAKNILNLLFLNSIDHIVGAALGLIKGTVLIYLMIMILDQVPYQDVSGLVDNSFLATNMMEMTPIIQKSLEDIFKRP